jgi:hypothetical protein
MAEHAEHCDHLVIKRPIALDGTFEFNLLWIFQESLRKTTKIFNQDIRPMTGILTRPFIVVPLFDSYLTD